MAANAVGVLSNFKNKFVTIFYCSIICLTVIILITSGFNLFTLWTVSCALTLLYISKFVKRQSENLNDKKKRRQSRRETALHTPSPGHHPKSIDRNRLNLSSTHKNISSASISPRADKSTSPKPSSISPGYDRSINHQRRSFTPQRVIPCANLFNDLSLNESYQNLSRSPGSGYNGIQARLKKPIISPTRFNNLSGSGLFGSPPNSLLRSPRTHHTGTKTHQAGSIIGNRYQSPRSTSVKSPTKSPGIQPTVAPCLRLFNELYLDEKPRSLNKVVVPRPSGDSFHSRLDFSLPVSRESYAGEQDEQVIMALREIKRKRVYREPELSSQNKRRRQESSASTCSIPPLPDNLPDVTMTGYPFPDRQQSSHKRAAAILATCSNVTPKKQKADSVMHSITSSLSSSKRALHSRQSHEPSPVSPKFPRSETPVSITSISESDTSMLNREDGSDPPRSPSPDPASLDDSSMSASPDDDSIAMRTRQKKARIEDRNADFRDKFPKVGKMLKKSRLSMPGHHIRSPPANIVATYDDYRRDREEQYRRTMEMLQDIGKPAKSESNKSSFNQKPTVPSVLLSAVITQPSVTNTSTSVMINQAIVKPNGHLNVSSEQSNPASSQITASLPVSSNATSLITPSVPATAPLSIITGNNVQTNGEATQSAVTPAYSLNQVSAPPPYTFSQMPSLPPYTSGQTSSLPPYTSSQTSSLPPYSAPSTIVSSILQNSAVGTNIGISSAGTKITNAVPGFFSQTTSDGNPPINLQSGNIGGITNFLGQKSDTAGIKPSTTTSPVVFNVQVPNPLIGGQPINNAIQPASNTIQPTNNAIQPMNDQIQPINYAIQPMRNTVQSTEISSSFVSVASTSPLPSVGFQLGGATNVVSSGPKPAAIFGQTSAVNNSSGGFQFPSSNTASISTIPTQNVGTTQHASALMASSINTINPIAANQPTGLVQFGAGNSQPSGIIQQQGSTAASNPVIFGGNLSRPASANKGQFQFNVGSTETKTVTFSQNTTTTNSTFAGFSAQPIATGTFQFGLNSGKPGIAQTFTATAQKPAAPVFGGTTSQGNSGQGLFQFGGAKAGQVVPGVTQPMNSAPQSQTMSSVPQTPGSNQPSSQGLFQFGGAKSFAANPQSANQLQQSPSMPNKPTFQFGQAASSNKLTGSTSMSQGENIPVFQFGGATSPQAGFQFNVGKK